MNTPNRRLERFPAAWRDAFLLTLLALVVNLVHVGTKTIVFDEATSVMFARLSFAKLLPVFTEDPNMDLYYALLNLWVGVFGESEVAVRTLSALLAALSVLAIYLLGARLFGRSAGFIAGLLLSLDAFIVKYAQTARGYALLLLLVTLSSYFFVIELEQPSRSSRIGYVLASTLAIYTHFFAGLVLVVHLGTVVAVRRRAAFTREWLAAAATILMLCAPAAIFAYRTGPGQIGWIARSSLEDVGPVLVDFAGGSRLFLVVLFAAGCWASALAVREGRWWRQGFVAAWLIVPVVLSFAISFVQPIFLSYYLIVCVPALVLFGAAALGRLRRPLVAGALVAPLVWLSATSLAAFYARGSSENWRDPTRYVLAATRSGDGIVFFPSGGRKPFEYYVRQAGGLGPANVTGQPLEGRERIWFVIRESDVAVFRSEIEQLRSSLVERYRLADRRGFRGVGVELYVR